MRRDFSIAGAKKRCCGVSRGAPGLVDDRIERWRIDTNAMGISSCGCRKSVCRLGAAHRYAA